MFSRYCFAPSSGLCRAGNTAACFAPCKLRGATVRRVHRVSLRCCASKDSTGFLDLANLVSGGGGAKTAYDELASKIGKEVYVDVNGWHLYLRDIFVPGADVKLSQALAHHLGSKVKEGLSKSDVEAALKKMPFKLGGGKTQVSLFEMVPNYAVQELEQIIQDYARSK
ncbi:hypothetical protein WJX81_006528 [Elliptochloris bilobata]|uniref:Uncharacterized protein n=1 Tax=Elliptochloris bilobata TaxID=381761 RepID=A0AAW1S1M1_9CHLO